MLEPRDETAGGAPNPIRHNPYRILGLPGEATWPQIEGAAERLLASPADRTTSWDLPWLDGGPDRAPGAVERARARLADPDLRLPARMLWFHERFAADALLELSPATIRNVLEGWSSTTQPVARHDAAVVALLAAFVLDPEVERGGIWSRALREWREALELEPYWMAVLEVEVEGGFPSPATLAEVRELRESALAHVAEPLLSIARAAVLRDRSSRALRALRILQEALPRPLFSDLVGDLAGHVGGDLATERETVPGTEPPQREEAAPPGAEEVAAPATGAAEPAEPEGPDGPEETAPEAVPPAGSSRTRRARWPLVVAAVVVGLLLVAVPRLPTGETEPPATERPAGAASTAILSLLEANDRELGRTLLERHRIERELEFARDAIAGYDTLAADYERRMRRRLPASRADYRRVVSLRREVAARRDSLLEAQRAANARFEALVRRDASLRRAFNLLQRRAEPADSLSATSLGEPPRR
ncbi:MAG: hypothetical protein R3199_10190 [Gemmatimonadota bacterium]|nr:hypothetical protein [Gemmatimonadota bacterium]